MARRNLATAVWVIDRVFEANALRGPSLHAPIRASEVSHAAFLLLQHAGELARNESLPGAFEWPASCTRQWPPRLDRESGGVVVLYALVDVLTSRERAWWGDEWEWAYDTLLHAYNEAERDDDVR